MSESKIEELKWIQRKRLIQSWKVPKIVSRESEQSHETFEPERSTKPLLKWKIEKAAKGILYAKFNPAVLL